ncbi:MAG: LUD domain-containing protein [Chloroflexi bacterium]|nr:LUD domain-containing protein [Chloroflexota bacterium]
MKLLARSATGQKISTYTSFITGARRTESEFGAREFHLILLDNGRTRIARDPAARETLLCIRCGACLNVCPVYNQVGGHAYGWVYSGPIGAILSPQLLGMQIARDLPYASTLCGACADVCPVKIPIPKILLHLRQRVAEGDANESARVSPILRALMPLAALGLRVPRLYHLGARLMRILQAPFARNGFIQAMPPPLNRWTDARALPAFSGTFRAKWKTRRSVQSPTLAPHASAGVSNLQSPISTPTPTPTDLPPARVAGTQATEIDQLIAEINALAGSARRVKEKEIENALVELIETESIRRAATWMTPGLKAWRVQETLRARGVEIIPPGADKHALASADLGITEADFLLPETGTLGLLSSPEKPRAVSLLPRVHLAIVRASALRADLHQVFAEAKRHNYLVFISGPSRTADIELTLTLGVHEPRALYVWIVE